MRAALLLVNVSHAMSGMSKATLLLLAATALLAATGCSTSHGITRVGVHGEEIIAETLYIPDGDYEGKHGTQEWRSHFASRDGGLTWTETDAPREIVWGEETADTPSGTYRTEGPDILFTGPDGQVSTVYSVEHWNTSSNRWYQAEKTRNLEDRVLTHGPTSITYDPNTGNLVAGMGIQGVVVATPDGQWTPAAVGRYSQVDYIRHMKLGELLSQHAFWITVVTFPMSMLALSLFLRDAIRRPEGSPAKAPAEERKVGIWPFAPLIALTGCLLLAAGAILNSMIGILWTLPLATVAGTVTALFLRKAARSTNENRRILMMEFTFPCTSLALVTSTTFLMTLGKPDLEVHVLDALQPIGAIIPLMTAISGSMISWRRQWEPKWQVLAASYLAMTATVAILFMIWVLSDISVVWPRLASFALCSATAAGVYRTLRI